MNDEHALRDHALRDIDLYARTKYEMTIGWLSDVATASSLVNVGCGSGVFNEMAVDAGFRVAGYEPDPAAYELALQRLPPRDCTVACIGLFDIPHEATASVVVMHDVLEHIGDERAAVEQLHRLVDSGGRAIISVPAMPSLFGLHDEMLGHHRRYTRATLRAALEPSFEITRLRAFGFAFIPLTLYYSRWRRRPYPLERTAPGGLGEHVRAIALRGRATRGVPARDFLDVRSTTTAVTDTTGERVAVVGLWHLGNVTSACLCGTLARDVGYRAVGHPR